MVLYCELSCDSHAESAVAMLTGQIAEESASSQNLVPTHVYGLMLWVHAECARLSIVVPICPLLCP